MKWNGVLSLIKQIKKFAEKILSDLLKWKWYS